MGDDLSGITWTNGSLPKTDYEISLDAVKVAGRRFLLRTDFSRRRFLVQPDCGRLGRRSGRAVQPG
jgi:hypothetical protein